ncbi:MAG: acetyl-CoA C-acyltransferase [Evtepia sp.]
MDPRDVVIVSACRTPIGKFMGQFASLTARDLAMIAGKEAITRAGIDPKIIDQCVMGELYTGLQGSLPARQVSIRLGLDDSSNAVSVNQNCASGMRALEVICNDIQLGKSDIGLAIGVESMTNAPYMLEKARLGYRMGDSGLVDSMIHDGLFDALSDGHMGMTAENVADLYHISREDCDNLAVMSHQRACAAIDAGVFKEEIVPVVIKSKKGEKICDTDEHPIRGCSVETISKLKPAFKKDGVVTAANASGVNDAAAAVIVMSAEKAKELGLKPMAKMVHICGAGVAARVMGLGPAVAIPKCLKAAHMDFKDVEYWEINEAFAPQFLGVGIKLKEEHGIEVDMSKTNHNGSGISLGHPVGCTGLRIIVSLIYEMQRHDYKLGGASLCVGGGPAMASLWTRNFD